MEKDVKGDTSGCFRKLLVAQMACARSESATFDLTAAKKDAQALLQAGEKKWGTDESMLVYSSTYLDGMSFGSILFSDLSKKPMFHNL